MTTEDKLQQLRRENDALRSELLQLRQLAYRDPLTGLRNRRYFAERLDEEIDRGRRNDSTEFSLLIVDVDHFKRINDEHGHAAGDETLCFVAHFLEENLRDHDICCRTGGDEFAVILPLAGPEGAELTIARIQAELVTANLSRTIKVSLSLGHASWPLEGSSGERLMECADRAMYRDKASRRRARSLPSVPARGARPARDRLRTIPWGPELLRSEA